MTRALQPLPLFLAAAGFALAQEPAYPAGNWQSAASDRFSSPFHPVVTGAEFYLKIDVSNDGRFSGEWRKYSCSGVTPGAYGIATFPCRFTSDSERAAGSFGPGRQGVIELGRLGHSAFRWSTPAAGELLLELPRNWQGSDAQLWRARLTRDGKGQPAAAPQAADAGPLLSANALYREFKSDFRSATARYAGKTLVLEGRRGTLIPLDSGGAAIHIPDGFQPRALVLVFEKLREVSGIAEGAQFRFRCVVESFDYEYVHLMNCSIVR